MDEDDEGGRGGEWREEERWWQGPPRTIRPWMNNCLFTWFLFQEEKCQDPSWWLPSFAVFGLLQWLLSFLMPLGNRRCKGSRDDCECVLFGMAAIASHWGILVTLWTPIGASSWLVMNLAYNEYEASIFKYVHFDTNIQTETTFMTSTKAKILREKVVVTLNNRRRTNKYFD